MPDAVIIGASGHGREVLDNCLAAADAGLTDLHVIGFIDDDVSLEGKSVCNQPVLGRVDWLRDRAAEDIWVLVGVGNPTVHRDIVRRVAEIGLRFGTISHPSVVVSPFAEIGEGTVVSVNSLIMSGARIGQHVTVNTGVSIAHDVVIDDFANIAPGVSLAGNIHVGAGVDIGIGASLTQGIEIGEWAIVGAGAVVIHDAPANSTVSGVPATVREQR